MRVGKGLSLWLQILNYNDCREADVEKLRRQRAMRLADSDPVQHIPGPTTEALEVGEGRGSKRAIVIQIKGASYRMRNHTDLVPEHVRINAPSHLRPRLKNGDDPAKNRRNNDLGSGSSPYNLMT